MARVRVAGAWKEAIPMVKVAGQWKDIEVGWVKVGGQWRYFKRPYVAKNYTVSLQDGTFTDAQSVVQTRRSFVRSGSGPLVGTPGPTTQGSISNQSVVIDGVTYQIRGIETGSDEVAGPGTSWKWVSIQFFGNVDPMKLARDAKMGGKRIIYVGNGGGYNASADHTYLTYQMESAYQFPAGVNLALQF